MQAKDIVIGQHYMLNDHPVKVVAMVSNPIHGEEVTRVDIRINSDDQDGAFMRVKPSELSPLSPFIAELLKRRQFDRYGFAVSTALKLEREIEELKLKLLALEQSS